MIDYSGLPDEWCSLFLFALYSHDTIQFLIWHHTWTETDFVGDNFTTNCHMTSYLPNIQSHNWIRLNSLTHCIQSGAEPIIASLWGRLTSDIFTHALLGMLWCNVTVNNFLYKLPTWIPHRALKYLSSIGKWYWYGLNTIQLFITKQNQSNIFLSNCHLK